jgi:hypothetical protein
MVTGIFAYVQYVPMRYRAGSHSTGAATRRAFFTAPSTRSDRGVTRSDQDMPCSALPLPPSRVLEEPSADVPHLDLFRRMPGSIEGGHFPMLTGMGGGRAHVMHHATNADASEDMGSILRTVDASLPCRMGMERRVARLRWAD